MAKIGTITIYPINANHGAEFMVEQDITPFVTKRGMTRWGAIRPSNNKLMTDLLEASTKDKESWVRIETKFGTIGISASPQKFRRILAAIVLPETQKDGMENAHTYIPGVFIHLYNKSSGT